MCYVLEHDIHLLKIIDVNFNSIIQFISSLGNFANTNSQNLIPVNMVKFSFTLMYINTITPYDLHVAKIIDAIHIFK
jgi:hypothetical protein